MSGDKGDIHEDYDGLEAAEIRLLLANFRADVTKAIADGVADAKSHADRRDEHMKNNILQAVSSSGTILEMKISHLEVVGNTRHAENQFAMKEAKEIAVANGDKIDSLKNWQSKAAGGLLVINIAVPIVMKFVFHL